jgi:hypothetical protein
VKVPGRSFALKLYAIFALMAIAALGLAMEFDGRGPLWVSALAATIIVALAVAAVRGIARAWPSWPG